MRRRNIFIFFVVVSLFGLTFGIYEISIPFYLQSQKISFPRMGDIFAVSFLFAFLMRQYAGYLSDIFGRRLFFSVALFLSGLGNFCTPFFNTVGSQAILKSLREGAFGVKETMQSVILYEGAEKEFLNAYGKNRGIEWIFQAVGIFLAGIIAIRFSLSAPFLLSGIILFLATALFWSFFQAAPVKEAVARRNVREIFSFDLTGKLRYLTVIYFILCVDTGLSHGPTMPIYFRDRFGMSLALIALLMVAHRLSMAFPMIFTGRLLGKRPKLFYIITLIFGGLSMVLTPFISKASIAIPVWITHDLLGASIYMPIHNYLVQKYAGEDIRGLHVSKSFAYGSLGMVVGFFLSGYLYDFNIGAPFFAAGLTAFLACFLVARL
ncbi:MAG: MFS transporter [Candidatus Omnitrophica bacterium]|nr:MFS transporter [Candidatus Omnitrophota bacterium]